MGASEPPMGDASDFSGGQPPMPNDMPAMDDGQGMQGMNDMPQDGGGMPPMPEQGTPSGSKIDDIYNQLSDEDKKATEKYAQSLLDRSEENGEPADMGEIPDNGGATPMQEVYVMREGKLVPGKIGYRRKNRR